ncbi:universal stress protein [Streptomyces violascens]|uniref:universal stress protein n=1 Tax=Streptomyces violascens TaxID=67381 RepID=UPI00369303A6
MMLKPIVAGLDGSRESLAAADWAAREALLRGLPLRLVHAWEGLPDHGEPVSLPELSAPRHWARRVLRNAMDQLTERYPQVYVSAEQIGRPPIAALLSEAEDAELLVLGNQGFGGPSGLLAGSVAMAVAARVDRPVVLVRASCTPGDERVSGAADGLSGDAPYRDVAVAVDLSHEPASLLEFAFEAARCRAAGLRVLYVWHLSNLRDPSAQAQREAEWALAATLDPWRDKFPTVPVQALAVGGRPTHHVLELARDAGLLVIGRETHHPATAGRLGRVAHAAVHHVRCPVAMIAHG